MKKARVIAYYLPQYHPIPENDKYWGKGFTEWTNVAKAKPLFKGHVQPRIPADLGFYDLRIPEIRQKQAELAKEAGIEGFCYWHYWFGNGKELLERPFNEVVASGEPDFPFCLGWANHSWVTKTWTSSLGQKNANQVIVEQLYPGDDDHIAHFYKYLPAFCDKRYIKVDGKLLMVIWNPRNFVDFSHFKDLWNSLAKKEGLGGFHFVGITTSYTIKSESSHRYEIKTKQKMDQVASNLYDDVLNLGFDGVNPFGDTRAQILSSSYITYYWKRLLMHYNIKTVAKYNYQDIIRHYYCPSDNKENIYPTIIPNFDRTPRAGWRTSNIWYNSTPNLFKQQVNMALQFIKDKTDEHKILFLKSWNEWGEGNYMEPDLEFGHGYLNALRECIFGE